MDINRIIMSIFALGAIVGGIDFIFGSKHEYGKQFESAIRMMAPTAFNMVGIVCLTPAIALVLKTVIAPVFIRLGIDPAMAGGVLALDMGGYPLAMELASDRVIGRYSGILVGCIFGCTLVFAIPFGMGVIKKETQKNFLQGLIIGLIAMPAGLIAGGCAMGMNVVQLLFQTLPVIICSLLLIFGLIRIPNKIVRGFQLFANGLKYVIRFGLVIAAVFYLFDFKTQYLYSITEGMSIVVNITLVLLGSLPFATILQNILGKPLKALGKTIHIQEKGCVALLIALVSSVPVFTMLDKMDRRSCIVVSAFTIDAAAILGAHLAYTAANEASMTGPLLCCKAVAGIVAVIIALVYSKKS
ncbi:MAG: ethanolamine utilization protein EutH [Agathobacter sp.]|nr:ethanolamine utilization protein EutH [Agathobacter sp.]